MGLTTATAFNTTPFTRARGLLVLGTICPNGVDEDLYYQLIVSFVPALERIEAGDDRVAVNLLRCIQKMTSGLVQTAKGARYVLWIAVSLIHAGKVSVFSEAALLLHAMLGALCATAELRERPLDEVFAMARDTEAIEEKVKQIDAAVGLTFDGTNFSISLANALFRGMRQSETISATKQLLELLLLLSTRAASSRASHRARRNGKAVMSNDALGFFLALLPTCTTDTALKELLHGAGASTSWVSTAEGDSNRPRLAFDALGITDENTAVLVVTFLIGILETAERELEQEMLFDLLAQAGEVYPDVIALA